MYFIDGSYVINWTIVSIRNTYKKYKNKNINIYLFVMYFLLISNSLLYMLYMLIHVYAFAEPIFFEFRCIMYRLFQISTGEPCQNVWEVILSKRSYIFHGSIRLPFQGIKGKVVWNTSNQMHSSYSMIIIYFKLFSTLIHTGCSKLFKIILFPCTKKLSSSNVSDYSFFILSFLISSFTKSKLKYLFLTNHILNQVR